MCDVGCELRAAGELEPPRLTVYKDIGRTMPGAVSNSGFCRQVMQTSVFPRIVCKILILKRKWWNWQTHHLEGVAPKGVGVQIPPSAPARPRTHGIFCAPISSSASVARSTSSRDDKPLTATAPATTPSFQMGMPPPQPTNLGSP